MLDLDGRRAAGQHGATEAPDQLCTRRGEGRLRETKKQQPEINPTRTGLWGTEQAGKCFKVPQPPPTGNLEAGDWYSRCSGADPGKSAIVHPPRWELSHHGIVQPLYQEETAGDSNTKCRKPQPPRGLPMGPLPVWEAQHHPAWPTGTLRHLQSEPASLSCLHLPGAKYKLFVWHLGNSPRGKK